MFSEALNFFLFKWDKHKEHTGNSREFPVAHNEYKETAIKGLMRKPWI
jgi:hypothetical protein